MAAKRRDFHHPTEENEVRKRRRRKRRTRRKSLHGMEGATPTLMKELE